MFQGSTKGEREGVVQLTVLAVNSTEAWWTLADVTNKGVAPVGLTDLTCSSVVARVWMARACVGRNRGKHCKEKTFPSKFVRLFFSPLKYSLKTGYSLPFTLPLS